MENKEYYIPTIEELFINSEVEIYEQSTTKLIKDVKWHKVKVVCGNGEYGQSIGINRIPKLLSNNKVRNSYLCKQDIIDLGFSTPPYTQIEGYEYYKFLEDNTEVRIVLNDYEDYSKIKIKYDLDLVFEGICKSKNELKKLLKDYLNIHI